MNMLEEKRSFVKDHKKEILFAGCITGAVVAGVLIGKRIDKKWIDLGKKCAGKHVIGWVPIDSFMNLERVKEILDANMNNPEPFAIFKEGPNPDGYICIMLSDNVIIP